MEQGAAIWGAELAVGRLSLLSAAGADVHLMPGSVCVESSPCPLYTLNGAYRHANAVQLRFMKYVGWCTLVEINLRFGESALFI